MKKLFSLIAFVFFAVQISGQTSEKLSGSVISSLNNNDGYTYGHIPNHNGNRAENAFDGDLGTFFASSIDESSANGGTRGSRGSRGGWVGLDLGTRHVITSVRYAPRPDDVGPERVECGVIQGANRPDFMDAVAIGIIAEPGIPFQLSTLNINSTRGFRYVRFYGSLQYRANIAELEFYGYESDGNDTHIGQLTNLPTVNIQTVNEARVLDRENYVNGTITIVDGSYIKTDNLEIRGRGNASWNFKKRPYRIRFATSTRLFNNPETPASARNWTLISNEGDKTLMRNLIAFDISKRLEMPYTPEGRLVDVVINGDYKGTYQLCDHIDIRRGRIDINEMTRNDISGAALTGGYHFEISAYAHDPGNISFNTNRGMPIEIKSPDFNVPEHNNYIRNLINTWESAVMNNGNYQQYMDIESFVKHFLTGELSGNTDTYWQTKMYKKRNDDKFYFGPVWDFDLAFENDQRTHPIIARTQQNNNAWLYQWGGSTAYNVRPLIDRLIAYNDVNRQMQDIWAQYRNSGAISEEALLQTVDNYVAQIIVSQDLNFKRWDNLYSFEHEMWGRGNYADNIAILKNYISERLAWMDDKLDYVPTNVTNPEFENVIVFSQNDQLIISNLSEKTKISCYDFSGRIIFEDFAENNFSKNLLQGFYLIKLTKQNGAYQTFKTVMQ